MQQKPQNFHIPNVKIQLIFDVLLEKRQIVEIERKKMVSNSNYMFWRSLQLEFVQYICYFCPFINSIIHKFFYTLTSAHDVFFYVQCCLFTILCCSVINYDRDSESNKARRKWQKGNEAKRKISKQSQVKDTVAI